MVSSDFLHAQPGITIKVGATRMHAPSFPDLTVTSDGHLMIPSNLLHPHPDVNL